MKNKKVVITADQINNSGLITVEAYMVLYQNPSGYGLKSGLVYPREMQVLNTTGADLEYNIIANSAEYDEYVADNTNFGFILLPNDSTLEDNANILNRCYKFLVRKESSSASATSDLRIDFINYGGYEFRWV